MAVLLLKRGSSRCCCFGGGGGGGGAPPWQQQQRRVPLRSAAAVAVAAAAAPTAAAWQRRRRRGGAVAAAAAAREDDNGDEGDDDSSSSSSPTSSSAEDALSDDELAATAAGGEAIRWAWSTKLLRRMLSFMLPALLLPMADPLMMISDTVAVGQACSAESLAAMAPANLLLSCAQYVFQALQLSAIALIGEHARAGDHGRAETTWRAALSLALTAGLTITLLFELFTEQLLAATGADAALLPLSATYLRVRACATPAALVIMVLQGGMLAQGDSRTPAASVGVAVAVNIALNLVFVVGLGQGLVGAAATTVATQLVGAGALLLAARRTSALAPGLASPRETLSRLSDLWRVAGPLSVTYVCKNLSYVCCQLWAASLPTLALAAHTAVFSWWNLLAFCSSPLEQAALAFVPRAVAPWQRRATLGLLFGVAAAIGLACGTAAVAVPLLAPWLLTRDAAVWPAMQSLAWTAGGAAVLTSLDVGATGVLLARRDLAYVARAFVVTLALLFAFCRVGAEAGWGLQGVWTALLLFFFLRASQSCGRLAWWGWTAARAAAASAAAAAAEGEEGESGGGGQQPRFAPQ